MSPGDIQDMIFKESDLPPFFSPDQPKFNTKVTVQRKRKAGNEGPDKYNENTIKGYVGESKGIKQILIERRLCTFFGSHVISARISKFAL